MTGFSGFSHFSRPNRPTWLRSALRSPIRRCVRFLGLRTYLAYQFHFWRFSIAFPLLQRWLCDVWCVMSSFPALHESFRTEHPNLCNSVVRSDLLVQTTNDPRDLSAVFSADFAPPNAFLKLSTDGLNVGEIFFSIAAILASSYRRVFGLSRSCLSGFWVETISGDVLLRVVRDFLRTVCLFLTNSSSMSRLLPVLVFV